MKYPILLIIFNLLIFSCNGRNENKVQVVKEENADSTLTMELLFELLAQEWTSTEQILDGEQTGLKNVFYINLRPDSTFNSFYLPDNAKKGHWRLNNDSTFTLFMKATDTYRILEITDSSLVTEALWTYYKTIYKFEKK